MRILIPENIKALVERIEKEYERLYKPKPRIAGEKVYSKIETATNTYINNEIYLYFANAAKVFRAKLDTQDTSFFNEDDEITLKKKIVSFINELISELSAVSKLRCVREICCEEDLKKVLNDESFDDDMSNDKKELLDFIKERQTCSWGKDDSDVDRIFFKLVRTLEDFESLLTKNGYEELTQDDTNPFSKIRIAFVEKPKHYIYKEKGILDEFNSLLLSKNFSSEVEVFDMWNDVMKTGLYYVYVPNSIEN